MLAAFFRDTVGKNSGSLLPTILTVDTTKTSAGSSAADQFRLPLVSSGSYGFRVDWGDASSDVITVWNQAAVTHTYAAGGVYTLTLTGAVVGFDFNNTGDRLKITDIAAWGSGLRFYPTPSISFEGDNTLALLTAADYPQQGRARSLARLFKSCPAFNQEIGTWDTSQVLTISETFRFCTSFTNGADAAVNPITGRAGINGWDVSRVQQFSSAFGQCVAFDRPLTDWDTSGGVNFSFMFLNCTLFNQPLGAWDMRKAYFISGMFSGCPAFNQPLGAWVLDDLHEAASVFQGCPLFDQDLGSWNMSKVIFCNSLFFGATVFNNAGSDSIKNWDMGNVTDMNSMFRSARAFNQPIGSWDVSKNASFYSMFADAQMFDQPLNAWDTGSATIMSLMFNAALAFNKPLGAWNTSKVLVMDAMFSGASAFNQDISTWDVSKVTDMNQMFQTAVAFNQPLDAWDTGSCTKMNLMFNGAVLFNQPLNGWDTSKVTTMQSMFQNARAFNQDLNSWDVRKVTSMQQMFFSPSAPGAFNGDISAWVPVACTSFSGMFQGGSAINNNPFNRDIGNWDTSAATTFATMFQFGVAFNQDLGKWNVERATTIASMFNGAVSMKRSFGNWWPRSPSLVATTFCGGVDLNSPTSPGANLRPNPQAFGSWTLANATVTSNVAAKLAPDGLQTVDKLLSNATLTANHQCSNAAAVVIGTTYRNSVWVSAAEYGFVNVVLSGGLVAQCQVDLTTGAIISGAGTVTDGGNGWWMIELPSGASTTTSIVMAIQVFSTNSLAAYSGVVTSGIYLWNAVTSAVIGGTTANYNDTLTGLVGWSGGVGGSPTLQGFTANPAVTAPGGGYTLGDILTVSGGTLARGQAAQVRVTALNGFGGVALVTTHRGSGNYSAPPASPAATSGGTGAGCTITPTWVAKASGLRTGASINFGTSKYGFLDQNATQARAFLVRSVGSGGKGWTITDGGGTNMP
jgi:surface protein